MIKQSQLVKSSRVELIGPHLGYAGDVAHEREDSPVIGERRAEGLSHGRESIESESGNSHKKST